MSISRFLAIDIGVSTTKIGLYDTEGKQIDVLVRETPGKYPSPGIFIQSSEEIFKIIKNNISEIARKNDASGLEAISISGAMGGAMGVSDSWDVVVDWSIVSDARSYPYAEKMMKDYGDKIRIYSGTNLPSFAPKLLWWKNEFPSLYKQVAKFIFLGGFIVAKMCNLHINDAFVDKTYLQMTGLADIKKSSWDKDICKYFGIDIGLLPNIVNPTSVVGRLDAKIARECGLESGIPVVAGAGDKPASALGAGIVKEGMMVDESASFSAFSVCIDKYIPDKSYKLLENIPSVIRGQYLPSFFILGSGLTNAWFKNTFAVDESEQAERLKKSSYQILDEKAQNIPPGSDNLLAIGHLGGRSYQQEPYIKGLWLGHTWSHKKEHFYKSLLESFAYEYGIALNVIKKNYPDLELREIRVIGGGSHSDLWNQIKSDVTNLKYVKLDRDDFALLGNVLISGKAIGIYEDLRKEALKMTKSIKVYYPNTEHHKIYKKYVKLYAKFLKEFQPAYKQLEKMN